MAENTNNKLFFRWGASADLKADNVVNGAITFTTDEPAIYLDYGNTHKRIGDLIIVKTHQILTSMNPSEWSLTALYFVEEDQALMKYMGAEAEKRWIRLNNLSDVDASISEIQADLLEITGVIESQQGLIDKNIEDIGDIFDAIGTLPVEGEGDDQKTISVVEYIERVSAEVAKNAGDISDIKTEDLVEIGTAITNIQESLQIDENGKLKTLAELKTEITGEYEAKIDQKLQAADAMTFKGVLGQEDNQIKALPSGDVSKGEEKVNAGDTYKVAYAGKYNENKIDAHVGDLIIAESDQGSDEKYNGEWIHISSGYEDSYAPSLSQEFITDENGTKLGTKIKLTGGAGENSGEAVIKNSDNIKFELNDSGEVQINLVWGTF